MVGKLFLLLSIYMEGSGKGKFPKCPYNDKTNNDDDHKAERVNELNKNTVFKVSISFLPLIALN